MSTDLRARLDQMDAALAAGTKGPWWVGPADTPAEAQEVLCPNGSAAEAWEPEDAALIVAAVNALPGLLAAIRAIWDEHDGARCHDRTFESLRDVEHCPTRAALVAAVTDGATR